MDKFAKFWEDIWEDESEIPNKKWMEKIKESTKDKIRQVEELQITEKELGKTIEKRKNWSALGGKFLVENTEINMGKTSNGNAGMDRRSKQCTKMANTRISGAYTQD